jgi:hypothetical protein
MRRLGHKVPSPFFSSLQPGAFFCFALSLLLFSSDLSFGLVLPQTQRRASSLGVSSPSLPLLEARDEAAVVGPGLLADLTLPLGAGIGAIVGAYAGCLVIVAGLVAALLPVRRRALKNGAEEAQVIAAAKLTQAAIAATNPKSPAHVRNFSYPSPRDFVFPQIPPQLITKDGQVYQVPAYDAHLSQSSVCLTPISDPLADQKTVMESRNEAHEQLADLYKLVLQQDEERHSPQSSNQNSPTAADPNHSFPRSEAYKEKPLLKKTKAKPASLSLDKTTSDGEKRKSRGTALLSALLSPRRKTKGLSISSPLMTPMSAGLPNDQEMHPLTPRYYVPKPPPPVPVSAVGITPDQSPPGSPVGTIDERLNHHRRVVPRASQSSLGPAANNRQQYGDDDEGEEPEQEGEEVSPDSIEGRLRMTDGRLAREPVSPVSMTSQNSQGLPSSPRPNVTRFSGLPQSPKPGATFQNQIPMPPTAVRHNGTLALRAYEPVGGALLSPQFKQTTFERTGMLSPASPNAVPYTPYQPFTPCFPMSPTLVTKEDRKRMKKMEPKTPTVEMVRSNDEMW